MSNRIMGSPGYSKRNLLLFIVLIFLVLTLTLSMSRLYACISSSLGREIAMVIIAAAVAWVLFIFSIGIGLGGFVELSVNRKILLFRRTPKPGSWLEIFLKLWGNKSEKKETKETKTNDTTEDTLPTGLTMIDIEELLEIVGSHKRGGKKSQYSDEVRFRAVRDWMILQANGTSLILQQFLEERFGVANETGMPLVPNQTFYGWRTQFIKELKKYQNEKQNKK